MPGVSCTCNPPKDYFNIRNDNQKIDLRIGVEQINCLKETLSSNNFDFNPFVKNRIKLD
jgi:hypothetical protein